MSPNKKKPQNSNKSSVSTSTSTSTPCTHTRTSKSPGDQSEGCRKCGRDDDHPHLLLCEFCNDEYHTYCLDPPLNYVPEGDFFCDKCKPLKAFCRNDALDEQVAALPPSFTSRFGEIIWAAGGVGFGWWPACIYDPRLCLGGARKLALKNIGKKHLVYFFGCSDAPFTVLTDGKCMAWEMGMLEEYDLGKTAKSMGKTRSWMFEWALQAAIAENDKPIECRLDWNHEEDAAVVSGFPPRGAATAVNGTKPQRNSNGTSTKRSSPVNNNNNNVSGAKKKTKTEKNGDKGGTPPANKKGKSPPSAKSGNNNNAGKVTSKSSLELLAPQRKSMRERKPSRALELASTSILESLGKTAKNSSSPSNNNINTIIEIKCLKSAPSAIEDIATSPKFFCKICKLSSLKGAPPSRALESCSNIGFVTMPSRNSSNFADARSIMTRDLDEGCLPSKWKFYVPCLGPLSRKQEKKFGPLLKFLKDVTNDGDGSILKPLTVLIYEAD